MTEPTHAPTLKCGCPWLGYCFPAIIAVGTSLFWAFKGCYSGWTQTQTRQIHTDEITGIEYTTYEDVFIPGIDFLAAGLGMAFTLALAIFLIRKLTGK